MNTYVHVHIFIHSLIFSECPSATILSNGYTSVIKMKKISSQEAYMYMYVPTLMYVCVCLYMYMSIYIYIHKKETKLLFKLYLLLVVYHDF